jgi:hypothetical protein
MTLCCQREHQSTSRLRLFADLCGLRKRENIARQCQFFFRILLTLFPESKDMTATYNSSFLGINRWIVLDSIDHLFSNTKEKDPDMLEILKRNILHMPAKSKELQSGHIIYLVSSIDHLLFSSFHPFIV